MQCGQIVKPEMGSEGKVFCGEKLPYVKLHVVRKI